MERRTARRQVPRLGLPLSPRSVGRGLEEGDDEPVVVKGGRGAVQTADGEERLGVVPKLRCERTGRRLPEEGVEQRFGGHDGPQLLLVPRRQVRVLLRKQRLVEGVVRRTETEQHVDRVDRREVARVDTPVLHAAHAMRFVVRPDVEEEPVDVEGLAQRPAQVQDVVEPRPRLPQQIRRERAGDPERPNASQRRGRALVRQHGKGVVQDEDTFVFERGERTEGVLDRPVVDGLVGEDEPWCDTEGRCQRPGERPGGGLRTLDLMTAARAEVEPDRAEEFVPLVVGLPRRARRMTFRDPPGQLGAFAADPPPDRLKFRAVVEDLRPGGEVRLLQPRIESDEVVPDPPVEVVGSTVHGMGPLGIGESRCRESRVGSPRRGCARPIRPSRRPGHQDQSPPRIRVQSAPPGPRRVPPADLGPLWALEPCLWARGPA